MSKYMDEFFRKSKDKPHGKAGERQVIRHDRFDSGDLRQILKEMKDFRVAEAELGKAVVTGHEAMGDEYFSLVKADPELYDDKDVRPGFLVNRRVMDEAMGLKEQDELRMYSIGDPIQAGLSCVTMEPTLEALFDKLEEEQKLAQSLEQMMQGLEGLAGEAASAEQMVADALAAGDQEGAQNFQDQAAKIQEQMEKLREQLEAGLDELNDKLDAKGKEIKDDLKNGLNKAIDEAKNMETMGSSWGLERGQLLLLDAQRRIELSKKVNNEKFKRLALLFGPLKNMAMAEQRKKITHAPEEVFNLEQGAELDRVLIQELMYLKNKTLKFEFYRRFLNRELIQFKMKGTQRVAKGGIIFCEDGSGSMSGDREVWAKAVGLALLQIARLQKRDFFGIHFGSINEIKTFDFNTKTGNVHTKYGKHEADLDQIDGVIDFASTFFSGGTDFVTPLSTALDILRKQHADYGAVRGDIVFVTDGQCGVPDEWMKGFKLEQERLGFKVWAIVIGGEPKDEPLATIADHKVITIKNLMSGEDIKDIFRDV